MDFVSGQPWPPSQSRGSRGSGQVKPRMAPKTKAKFQAPHVESQKSQTWESQKSTTLSTSEVGVSQTMSLPGGHLSFSGLGG